MNSPARISPGIAGLVGLITAGLYLSVLPRQLTGSNYGMDAGDFLSAILTAGIPHPSGYPTYLLLGRLLQQLPFGTPVFKGALLSALPMAAAAGLLAGWAVWFWGQVVSPRRAAVTGLITGLAFGTAPLVFSQAVIVEVQGLHMLFWVCLCAWLVLVLFPAARPAPGWARVALAGGVGLGLGNHLTLALMAPLLVWGFWRQRAAFRQVWLQILALALGSLVYLYLPLAARLNPPVNWGGAHTWPGLVWEVSGAPYRDLLLHLPDGLLVERLRGLLPFFLDQFGPLGLALAALGAGRFFVLDRRLAGVLFYSWAVSLAFSLAYASSDAVVYRLPACLVMAVWLGGGVMAVWAGLRRGLWGQAAALAMALSLLLRLPATFSQVDPRPFSQPAQYVESLLAQALPGALVLTESSEETFPLWYVHFGLGRRADLRVVVLPLTRYTWYQRSLIATYPDLRTPPVEPGDRADAAWGDRLPEMNPMRPTCTTRLDPGPPPQAAFECDGVPNLNMDDK